MYDFALLSSINTDGLTSTGSNLTDNLTAWANEQMAALTPANVAWSIFCALLVGLIISFVYKRCYRGVLYSPSFGITLVLMTLVTTPVVMCIGSNVALSMGMVGALSIVRFRTAVKDPLDTAYMFWALTMGIILGAGMEIIAFVVVVLVGAVMFLLSVVQFSSPNAYLLVLHYDEDAEYDITQELRRSVKYRRLRSKTVTRGGAEMTYEVRLDAKQDIVSIMLSVEGVHDATLVACQTEAGT
ncbi:MAG: DUF4956 domain-containing protein [Clostridia bacterium]|nr:DUF4956 domain-containing protein [Clostridia bacterium]